MRLERDVHGIIQYNKPIPHPEAYTPRRCLDILPVPYAYMLARRGLQRIVQPIPQRADKPHTDDGML